MNKSIIKQCLAISRELNNPFDHPEWDCYHHFSFIVVDGRVIGYSTNRKGDPLIMYGYPAYGKLHAEAEAYRTVKHRLINKPFDVINIRLSKLGNLRIAKPCEHCERFLVKRGCVRAYYSIPWGFVQLNMLTGREKLIMTEVE